MKRSMQSELKRKLKGTFLFAVIAIFAAGCATAEPVKLRLRPADRIDWIGPFGAAEDEDPAEPEKPDPDSVLPANPDPVWLGVTYIW